MILYDIMIALDITAVTLIFSNSRNIIITMIVTKLGIALPMDDRPEGG